jgi:DNA polymerase IIIc chi subunit
MNTNVDGVFKLEETYPEHLAGLKNIHDQETLYISSSAEKEYANILKLLINIKNDKNSAQVNHVIEYIDRLRAENENLVGKWRDLMNKIRSFLIWAAVWTQRKSG